MRNHLCALALSGASIALVCVALTGVAHADDVKASAMAEAAKPEETTWDLSLAVRMRGEAKVNQAFGASRDVLLYKRPDQVDRFTQRTRVGVGARRANISGFVLLQQALVWGETGGDTLLDETIGVHQAWFQAEPSEYVALQVGRMELKYGDQRVLALAAWNQVGRAWDGARSVIKPGAGLQLDLFVAQYNEGSLNSPVADGGTYSGGLFDDDSWLGGLYFTVGKSRLQPVLATVDVYVLGETTFETAEPDAKTTLEQRRRVTGGSRIVGAWDFGLTATLEGALQTGSTCVIGETDVCTDARLNLNAWFFDSELTFDLGLGLKLVAGFGHATGDDPETSDVNEAYDHLYSAGHKWLGLMDIVGTRTNVRELRGGLKGKLMDGDLGFTLMGHDFTRVQPKTERTGSEVDAIVNYAFNKNLDLLLGYGVFLPASGATLDETAPDGVAHWGFVQAQASF